MAKTTSIEWTDHTWTPVVGCDAVSPACAKCYAALMAARLESMGQEKYAGLAVRNGNIGKWTGKVTFWEPDLVKPLEVRKAARWFLTSMGDIAHDGVSDEQIAQAFGVMAAAGAAGAFNFKGRPAGPHTFMVLTKRPQRLAQLLASMEFRLLVARAAFHWGWNRTDAGWLSGGIYPFDARRVAGEFWPLPNVFIGCTAENQEEADKRLLPMAKIAAAGWKTFVSYEPALGPVDWTGWEFLKQLISGGETGHKARPSHPDWHRCARDWAASAGVHYLFKQHGDWAPGSGDFGAGRFKTVAISMDGGTVVPGGFMRDAYPVDATSADGWALVHWLGKKKAGRLLDGRVHDDLAEASHA
jgi:protein gp37